MKKRNIEVKIIWVLILAIFAIFLVYPLGLLLMKSFETEGGVGIANYLEIFQTKGFLQALGNSFLIAALGALVATIFAFVMAYTVNYTNLPGGYKRAVKVLAVLPMLLPTITYGFAIIYSFGKQGVFTRIFGKQFFDIYGPAGLLIGYVIYTLPISFMLLNNTMGYIDKKYMVVSRVMGDSAFRTFWRRWQDHWWERWRCPLFSASSCVLRILVFLLRLAGNLK